LIKAAVWKRKAVFTKQLKIAIPDFRKFYFLPQDLPLVGFT
jgi:hypothetical protein